MTRYLRQLLPVVLAVVVVPAVTGCGWAVFNKIEASQVHSVSYGKELMDLQDAKTKGVISEAEYLKLKEKAMNRPDLKMVLKKNLQ